MAQRRVVGVIMNGVTGRMGLQPAPHPLDPRDPRAGRPARSRAATRSGPSRCWSDAASASWPRSRPSTGWSAGRPTSTPRSPTRAYEIYFDAQLTSARPPAVEAAIAAGKHVYCEKPVTPDVESALALARAGPRRRREGRRRAGQAVPAGAAEAAPAGGVRVLRAHHRRARRVRLLGLSRAGPEAAAAVVELSRRRRRRHHSGYALPLAICTCRISSLRCAHSTCLGARHIPGASTS